MLWLFLAASFLLGLVIGFTVGWVCGIRDMLGRLHQQIDRLRQVEADRLNKTAEP